MNEIAGSADSLSTFQLGVGFIRSSGEFFLLPFSPHEDADLLRKSLSWDTCS